MRKPLTPVEREALRRTCTAYDDAVARDTLRLLDERDALRDFAGRAVEALRKQEWSGSAGDSEIGFWAACPSCGAPDWPLQREHAPDCALAVLLREWDQASRDTQPGRG